ncbi:hypothetical protein RHMOL_Rhmol06G0163800 [Rhododendron molle]|uniref:Uncharacterized protein n=1 Tax=Rhododendron molle TaxID=49168 RepID=A0ACC0NE39_RHOML|nr:hypothetical protein RHMOL_Rhmol06G0163800 [Rhododendron molle]
MGTWRNISHLGLPYLISGRSTQAYLNGAAHWIGVDRERQCMMFVSFRMADESFHSMSLPAGIGEGVQRLIGFPREGELLIEARGDLISFRLRDVQVKGLGIHNNTGDWYKESLHTEAYVGSLVLLGSPEQTTEDEVACQEEKEVEVRCGEEEIESKEAAKTRHYAFPTYPEFCASVILVVTLC